ncbi:MAG: phenylacetate-CoA oxygenase subunit PaaC [Candidatus Kapabacteria bacterium]|nr:phenylacetate-CoA oxygenase subunit PaaC [Ignavibacteriota bacterium]MCW5885880.1 phenylacetate-CoA oxygenase subunit PaaC [Candidatus Kapabacteria bacterium]
MTYTDDIKKALFKFALRHGDDRLVLGHRVSEWCGHGPILEEDLALANLSLDLLGQATLWLKFAGETEGIGRDEDDLAYLRNEREFTNLLLTEQANEDFAYTTARQFYFDVYDYHFYNELKNSKDETLAGIAAKSLKESAYHLRHSSEWMLRLGDGTDISHDKISAAVEDLWMYTGEMFFQDETDELLLSEGIGVDFNSLKSKWYKNVSDVLSEATLDTPSIDEFMQIGGRNGLHTENLGFILADMQYLRRAVPDAKW